MCLSVEERVLSRADNKCDVNMMMIIDFVDVAELRIKRNMTKNAGVFLV